MNYVKIKENISKYKYMILYVKLMYQQFFINEVEFVIKSQ